MHVREREMFVVLERTAQGGEFIKGNRQLYLEAAINRVKKPPQTRLQSMASAHPRFFS